MSIYYSGTLTRSSGIVSAIGKELKRVNLKGVKRITVTFDPFAANVKSTREFLFLLSVPRVTQSNPNCLLKTDVVCNRQQPKIKFSLIESAQEHLKVKDIQFLSSNLNTLELLQLCNKYLSVLVPEEEEKLSAVTKSAAKAFKKKERR
uniref:Large ribosomal subunit protein mL53 n=1 Tax=Glossina palpalis gambiensis TaxID=67801 RepID=A0A1B0BXI8_9MUSC